MTYAGSVLRKWWLVVGLAGVATVANQYWVGGATIYGQDPERLQEVLDAILMNELPAGVESWSSIGANSTPVRVLAIWSGSVLQSLTGWNARRTFFIQDTLTLFLALILIFLFFERVAGRNLALVGMLYVAAILPLTYFLYWFHPWDRPSLVMWALALLLLLKRRWILLGLTLGVGVLIKFDIVIFPLLVFLAEFDARKPLRSFVLAGLLAVVTFGTFVVLVLLRPGAFGAISMASQVSKNLEVFWAQGLAYPPLLALSLPAVLAFIGFKRSDQFSRAGVIFCLFMTVYLFLRSNFAEFRAEMPLLLSLAPAALHGLRIAHQESLISATQDPKRLPSRNATG